MKYYTILKEIAAALASEGLEKEAKQLLDLALEQKDSARVQNELRFNQEEA